ncbi:hypothetical protein APHAL10511_003423 [Amanita phalloides]|nr:hypothetical protein APHAL10511_003423 [Amanita phalloides]
MSVSNWLRTVVSACPRHSLSRLYSTKLTRPKRSKWLLDGLPPPKSLLDDDAQVDLTEDNDIVNGARVDAPPPHDRKPPLSPTPYEYKTHRETLQKRFPAGWSPPKKLSREAMDGLRQLHRFDPETFTTPVLAEKFRVSPEAVRRILKSKWEPSREKRIKLVERERESRSERIRLSRMKERLEAQEVEELKRTVETPVGKRETRVVIKDGLTLN